MTRLAITALLAVATVVHAQPDAGTAKPIVAVLYFDVDDKQGDLTIFRKGLAEMLITDLVESRQLEVVERARLEDALQELKLQATKNFDQSTAVKVGAMIGAHYQITGSIKPLGKGRLMLEARVIELLHLKSVAAARAITAEDDILAGEQELVAKLLKGLADPTRLELAPPKPKTGKLKLDTAVKYGQALSAKDSKDPEKAKQLLTQVVAEQPDFILARLDLAALAK